MSLFQCKSTLDALLPDEFKSGNSIPVERATIKRERMEEIILAAIEHGRNSREDLAFDDRDRLRSENMVLREMVDAKGKPVAVVSSVVTPGSDGVRVKWIGGFPQIGDRLYAAPKSAKPAGIVKHEDDRVYGIVYASRTTDPDALPDGTKLYAEAQPADL